MWPTFIAVGDVFWFAAGGAVICFFKDPIVKFVIGAESFAAKLEAKARAIRAML